MAAVTHVNSFRLGNIRPRARLRPARLTQMSHQGPYAGAVLNGRMSADVDARSALAEVDRLVPLRATRHR